MERSRFPLLALGMLLITPVASAVPVTAQASSASLFACGGPTTEATCLAQPEGGGSPTPIGLPPARIKSAYGWPTRLTVGAGQTIAIVDAHDNPVIESDLAVFDHQYQLPECTTANRCLVKVDSSGGTNYPSYNGGWGFEIALDVEWAHAVAPAAKILLVEAKTANLDDLLAGEDYAKAHAQYVSNSWVTGEFKGEANDDSHFLQPGVSFFAGSGDSFVKFAYPTAYPSVSPNVVSVGGTQLNFDGSGNLLSETGWSGGAVAAAASRLPPLLSPLSLTTRRLGAEVREQRQTSPLTLRRRRLCPCTTATHAAATAVPGLRCMAPALRLPCGPLVLQTPASLSMRPSSTRRH